MSASVGDHMLLSCLKKLLLGQREVVQTGVCNILAQILAADDHQGYAAAVLDSDLVGKLCLNSKNALLTKSINSFHDNIYFCNIEV